MNKGKHKKHRIYFWGLALVLTMVCCKEQDGKIKTQLNPNGKDNEMSSVLELERMITAGDRNAIDLAQQLGEAAWPAINQTARLPEYRSRRIAIQCAGRIGGESAGSILAAGLSDQNVNVRISAAKELSVDPPETAKNAVLNVLSTGSETRTSILELLALAAGHLHGERTMQILQSLADGNDSVAEHASIALAKLGDTKAKQALISKLSDNAPYTRYEGLGQLRYVNDASFAAQVKSMLTDQANAQMIGPERNRRYRRVCDQAMDTLVYLLKLKPSFEMGAEKIYSHEELTEIGKLSK